MQPTTEEKRNGWTEAALTAYLDERKRSQGVKAGIIDQYLMRWGDRIIKNRPQQTDNSYNPHGW